MKAPFPYFGGKSKVAPDVWQRFGNVPNYVEPFFGSGAVLLNRPHDMNSVGIETVNDQDGLLSNFWRSIKHSPELTAEWANNPVNENDMHARHVWLLKQKDSLVPRLEGDSDYHDPKIAGWWVWGISCWIGSGWCSGNGPWWTNEEGQLVHLGGAGRGVNRQLVHLGGAGQGVNRKLVHLGDYFKQLSIRFENVRVCSGDWSRVCGPTPTFKNGITGVFLDPPYADTTERASDLYAHDCEEVAHAVRQWAIEQGDNPLMRIALCGYEGEHQMPDDWECFAWKARGGYGSQSLTHDNPNAKRERIWFSPACIKQNQMSLF